MTMTQKVFQLTQGKLVVEANDRLFGLLDFAERINPKRPYLFVSKVLGKHYPARLSEMEYVWEALAKKITHPADGGVTLVIGMAETATGLAWGVFSRMDFPGKVFMHTTRIQCGRPKLFEFSEPHSHAVGHSLYRPGDPLCLDFLEKVSKIILIDDEVTSGVTLRNLSLGLREIFPLADISVLTIVDWSDGGSADLPVTSLERAKFEFLPDEHQAPTESLVSPSLGNDHSYGSQARDKVINRYGRFGAVSFPRIIFDPEIGKYAGKRILVLGTGEFMYAAVVLAKVLDPYASVWVQSTTRSPVRPGGIISSVLSFRDNYDPAFPNFLYNVADRSYHHILIVAETAPGSVDPHLTRQLAETGAEVSVLYI